jgi:hypothetical protein
VKIRIGFVSNSSSTSFVVSAKSYATVFAIASAMLDIRNEDWGSGADGMPKSRLGMEAKAMRGAGRDPNTPVAFHTTNYDTYIKRCGGVYAVSTCNNHSFETRLDGVVFAVEPNPELCAACGYADKDIAEIDMKRLKENIESDLKDSNDFWWPQYDRVLRAGPTEARETCRKHGDEYLVEVVRDSGVREVVCPMCEFKGSIW